MEKAYRIVDNGVNLSIKVQPKSKKPGIFGYIQSKNGLALKVSVSEIAEDGKANQAVIKMIANKIEISASNISIIIGYTSRDKVIHIIGDIEKLLLIIEKL